MRLDFNILWVDDQPNHIKAQAERIQLLMRRQGFKLQTQIAKSIEEARSFIGNDVFGETGLEMIRDTFPYKDIVFYSAQFPQNLEDIVAKNKVPGVFCCHRSGLPDTVIGVFQALVKKVLDIDHSRGIVMGATSEIDDFVNRALDAYLAKTDSNTKDNAMEIAKEQIAKIRSEFEEDCRKLEAIADATELKLHHRVYSSAKRLILLRKLIQRSGRNDINIQAMINYETQTVPRRNTLAHVTVKRDGFSRRLFDRKGKELTADDMCELRVDLLTYHELFEALLNALEDEEAQTRVLETYPKPNAAR
jgi:hypothetical protein